METKIKTKTFVSFVSLIGLSFLMLIFYSLPVEAMANPASEYCVGVGGTLEIRTQEDGGQYGVCIFSDGSECEEWALYNGDCQKGLVQEERGEKNIQNKNQNKKAIAQLKEVYERLNKINQGAAKEKLQDLQTMVSFDENVSAEDFGIKKSGGILRMIGTFLAPGIQDSETEQIGILPDSKLYPFKNFWRKVKMTFTFNPIKKAELQERYTNEKFIETVKVYEKNKDSRQVEKLLEGYEKDIELIKKRVEKIKQTSKNKDKIDNFLDNLIDHLIKRQKMIQELKEELKEKLPPERYEKIEKQFNRTIEQLGRIIEHLEKSQTKLKERFAEIAFMQRGSEFRDFKNLEILKEIEEKMSPRAKEALSDTRKNLAKEFVQKMERMNLEERILFKEYVKNIKGNPANHLEIIEEIKSKEIPPEVRVELEKAREEAIRQVEEKMEGMKARGRNPEELFEHFKEGGVEKLRVIKVLENKLSPEFSEKIKKIKEENIRQINKKISKNFAERDKFIEKAKEFHDVSQFEILDEIKKEADDDVKVVINEAKNKVYKEFEKDIERAKTTKNKRKILEKLTTDQPKHIEVLTRVRAEFEGKLPPESKAPEVLNQVIEMQVEKINSQVENIKDRTKIEKFKEQIQKNGEIKKEIESRIPDFKKRMEARKNLIKKYRPILKKKPSEKICKDLCGDGICQEVVCMAVGCPCPETAESCPEDCKKVKKECGKEGQLPVNGVCCEGLVKKGDAKINKKTEECLYMRHLICLKCGDGECNSKYENKCNCPEDCKKEEKTCLEKCKSQGYVSGVCRTWPIYPGVEKCKVNEINIGKTLDCFVEPRRVGVGKGCCCKKIEEEFCTAKTGERLSLTKAKEIASASSECGRYKLAESHVCNSYTGTWWLDLDIEKPGCNPACVVNVITKEAKINWRCTGLDIRGEEGLDIKLKKYEKR